MSINQPYKVLVFIKSLGLGGAERLIVDSLPYLDRQRFDYHFAYFLPRKNYLVPQIEQAGFPVYCLGMNNNYQLPLVLPRLYRLLQQRRFDLIHAEMPQAGLAARLVGRPANVPVIYTEHNMQERFHPLSRWANRLTYGWNRHVLAVSKEVAASIRRRGLDRRTQVTPLLNSIPVEQVRTEAEGAAGLRADLDIPRGHQVVGSVAVFRRQKRLADWLEVAAQIASRRQDVTFLLVGDGPEMKTVQRMVADLGLAARVLLPGFRPDGRRLMGLMDIYLLTSEFEGLPIALLEAMALSKPVVCTAVGGIPELVNAGQDGYLAPVGAIDQLAGRVETLLDNPELRAKMGRCGAKKTEARFHIKQRVKFIENLYEAVLT